MTKTANSNRRTARTAKTVEQPIEVTTEVVSEVVTEPGVTLAKSPDESTEGTTQPVVAPEAEVAAPAVITDPFADLPMMKVGDFEFRDLTEVALVSEPRKYEGVHREAVSNKAHMKKGWKYSAAMIAIGTNKIERKPTSVYGTIQSIVQSYGRIGVPAYVLVAKVRQAQIGNKRSHYCTALPPIGWAEGWIDTFISKNMGKILPELAPAITAEVAEELQAGDAEALEQARKVA